MRKRGYWLVSVPSFFLLTLLNDTQISYDSTDGHWIVTALSKDASGSGGAYLYIGISKNANPESSYYQYALTACTMNTGKVGDNPIMGISMRPHGRIVVDLLCNSTENQYESDEIYAIDINSVESGVSGETGWLLAYEYGSVSPDPGSYTFTEAAQAGSEPGGLILGYRNVAITSPLSLSAWGFGFGADSTTVTIDHINVPAHNEVVAVFKVGADDLCVPGGGCSEITGPGWSYSPVSGPPVPLTSVTPRSFNGDGWYGFAADIWNGNTQNFGPYSTSNSYEGTPIPALPLGWEVLLPVGGVD